MIKKIWKQNECGCALFVNDIQIAWLTGKLEKDKFVYFFNASVGRTSFVDHELKSATLEEAKKEVEEILLAQYSDYVATLKNEVERCNKICKVLYTKDEANESVGDNNG